MKKQNFGWLFFKIWNLSKQLENNQFSTVCLDRSNSSSFCLWLHSKLDCLNPGFDVTNSAKVGRILHFDISSYFCTDDFIEALANVRAGTSMLGVCFSTCCMRPPQPSVKCTCATPYLLIRMDLYGFAWTYIDFISI